jgi:hypothetical protein
VASPLKISRLMRIQMYLVTRITGVKPIDPDSVESEYSERATDTRVLNACQQLLSGSRTLIDAGCGAGQYGAPLTSLGFDVRGFDIDENLVARASSSHGYTSLVTCDFFDAPSRLDPVDAVIAIEVVEHLSGESLRASMESLESLAVDRVLITVPNPRSPHFYFDPTHILEYTPKSLLKALNESKNFQYSLHGLGFHSHLTESHTWLKALESITLRFPNLSPSLMYLGTRVAER